MIYETEPDNFTNKHDIVSCFCECNGKVLFLLRADHKSEGNKWGPPAGKVNKGENILEAFKRETLEETGIELSDKDVVHLKKLFVRYPDYDFVYHVFKAKFDKEPKIQIFPEEHKEHRWVDLNDTADINFILDQDLVNNMFYGAQ